ncbi:MAG: hypothetical protein ABR924_22565, partial [Terracidiphilus sp.]
MNNLRAVFSRSMGQVFFKVLLLMLCTSGASAQQAQPPGQTSVADLPNQPQPQQVAQAAIPGLPALP